jgi:hypothetical protein
MKDSLCLLFLTILLQAGCGRFSKDETSLRPYTSIPTGSVVIVQMRIPGNVGFDVITTNEYVLEKFEDGFVTLRGTNGLSFGYAGSMIKSIERKTAGLQ